MKIEILLKTKKNDIDAICQGPNRENSTLRVPREVTQVDGSPSAKVKSKDTLFLSRELRKILKLPGNTIKSKIERMEYLQILTTTPKNLSAR